MLYLAMLVLVMRPVQGWIRETCTAGMSLMVPARLIPLSSTPGLPPPLPLLGLPLVPLPLPLLPLPQLWLFLSLLLQWVLLLQSSSVIEKKKRMAYLTYCPFILLFITANMKL
jgi:hypothetical protein